MRFLVVLPLGLLLLWAATTSTIGLAVLFLVGVAVFLRCLVKYPKETIAVTLGLPLLGLAFRYWYVTAALVVTALVAKVVLKIMKPGVAKAPSLLK